MALTPAQKQKAYRDRKRAIRDAPKIEAAHRAAELQRAKEEVERLVRGAAELAEAAAAKARQRAEEAERTRPHSHRGVEP